MSAALAIYRCAFWAFTAGTWAFFIFAMTNGSLWWCLPAGAFACGSIECAARSGDHKRGAR